MNVLEELPTDEPTDGSFFYQDQARRLYAYSQHLHFLHNDLLSDGDQAHTVFQYAHGEDTSLINVENSMPERYLGRSIHTLAFQAKIGSYAWQLTKTHEEGRTVSQIRSGPVLRGAAVQLDTQGKKRHSEQMSEQDLTEFSTEIISAITSSTFKEHAQKVRNVKDRAIQDEGEFSVRGMQEYSGSILKRKLKQHKERVERSQFSPTTLLAVE